MQAAGSFVVEPVGLVVEGLPRPLDFAALYGNDRPVELEIGCGKGTFVLEQARARPEVNFFGIEWANWFYRYAADRLRRHGCANARMIRADATFFLKEFVKDGSLSVLHVYFPDPWPKARHRRRRTVREPFMPEVKRVLRPGGELRVVTDHKGYWEDDIEPAVRGSGMAVIDYARPATAHDGETVGTNFERKYIKEGRPFYAIAAQNAPVPSPDTPGEG